MAQPTEHHVKIIKDEPENRFVGWLERLAGLRDGLLVTGGVFYVLGYMVWAINAYRNGLGLLPAIESQYFVAGLTPAIVICAVWLFIRWMMRLTNRLISWVHSDGATGGGSDRVRLLLKATSLLSPLGLISLCLMYLRIQPVRSLINESHVLQTFFVIALFACFLTFGFSLSVLPELKNRTDREKWQGHRLAQIANVSITTGLIALFLYLSLVYPNLPQALGGVKPRCAYLDIDGGKLSKETLKAVSAIPAEGGGPGAEILRSKKFQVLFPGNDTLIVRESDEIPTVYEITRDSVQAIIWCE